MKVLILILILLTTFNQVVLSDYTWFKIQDVSCQQSSIIEIDDCATVTSKDSIEGCTGSIHVVEGENDNQFSFETYSNNGECSLKDATKSIDFTCLKEGAAQNITNNDNSTSYIVSCFTQDPYQSKYTYFKVEKHLCQDRRDMTLDTCLPVSTAAIPNCNGSVDIQFSFGNTYNFDVYTNDDCGGDPFRVGPFTCNEDGAQVEARGFVVTCYVDDYLSLSSKLNTSFILFFFSLFLYFIF